VGDPLYGKGTTQKRLHLLSPELQRQLESVTMTFLHASSLEFTHPVTGHRHVIKAPRPASFELFLELLKKENTL
jgi:23S rRNA-/tRNA-specific pseudouridylate synthase